MTAHSRRGQRAAAQTVILTFFCIHSLCPAAGSTNIHNLDTSENGCVTRNDGSQQILFIDKSVSQIGDVRQYRREDGCSGKVKSKLKDRKDSAHPVHSP